MEQRRVNVRAVIWHDNRLLAVKHKAKDGSEASYWAVPGGGLDPFESLTDGIKRELLEETGKQAEVGEILFLQQFAGTSRRSKEELEFFYHIKNPQDFININLEETTHGFEELARIEFVDPKEVNLLPKFLSEIDIAEAIDNPRPSRLFSEL